ncbi:prolyl-tRNA synthetase [Patescibacteria group bacterium]|nr:prolyl-tRNA synthetase [Patescibacteria group bacterium]MBU4115635.1 prolyl-tRNA synthetase [Patescibacteria group bacterium]
MLQSKLFTKTKREAPKDEMSKNAELLTRGGFVYKEMAGVYSYLPLGYRVLTKINNIIREGMDAIGGQELFLSALQDKNLWEQTNRWSDDIVDIWFKTKLKNNSEAGLGFTHEEPLTRIMKDHISSYKDLPIFVYQIQTKFRNEIRARSGLIRGREFLMKDLYSFCKDKKEQEKFYEKAKNAYTKIFERLGLGDKTYITFASGGSFSKYSHEFQTEMPDGEDEIYLCSGCKKVAVNKDIWEGQKKCPECGNSSYTEKKSVEVGNIFNLGTKFSESIGLFYKDKNGEQRPVVMGSYGIGPGRVMGTIVETFCDEKGIIWPESVAPFSVHLLIIGDDKKTKENANNLYKELEKKGIEVLYDERDVSAGQKFADSDLIGIPNRVVVSEKTVKENKFEFKKRNEDKSVLLDRDELFKKLR